MSTPIQMPALSPTMTEGKITKWLKKEGDKVSSGEAVAEVETDKSNLEVEAYEDGVLIQITVKEGEMAKVGAPIAFIGEKGEKAGAPAAETAPKAAPALKAAPPPPAAASSNGSPAPSAPAAAPALKAVPPPPPEVAPAGGRLRASPLAKKMASEQGVDLASVAGSGPSGRIVKKDIEAMMVSGGGAQKGNAAVALARPAVFPVGETTSIPLTSMRKVIAQRMGEVKPGVPHFYLSVEVEMNAALKLKDEAKALELPTKISVNDLILKATGVALTKVPKMNVSFQGDKIVQFGSADVGIAVAIEDGLITPVLRNADRKTVSAISAEAKELAERARKRSLKPDEYSGGSITVSNLGMFGVDSFIAVINPPQAAILAVGAVSDKAVVRDGQVVARKMMTVMLSGDHRVIDGALGAVYLKELKELLEHPFRLLF